MAGNAPASVITICTNNLPLIAFTYAQRGKHLACCTQATSSTVQSFKPPSQ